MANYIITNNANSFTIKIGANSEPFSRNDLRVKFSEDSDQILKIYDKEINQYPIFNINLLEDTVDVDGQTSFANAQALFDSIEPIFFLINSGGGGGNALIPDNQKVNEFNDLPSASSSNGQYWIVDNATGSWITGNRRESGIYKSVGGNWVYRGADVPYYFEDDNLSFKDSSDLTKQLGFQLEDISTNTRRVATWQDKSGTVAFLDDIPPPKQPESYGKATSSFTGNLNTLAYNIIPFDNLTFNENSDFSIGPNGGIVIERAGSLICNAKIPYNDGGNNNQRLQLQLIFAIDGVPLGTQSHNGYLRDSNGTNTSEASLRETFAQVNAGSEITILCRRLSNISQPSNLINADAYLDVFIRESIDIDPPVIDLPSDGDTITFIDGIPSTYQCQFTGLAPVWQLTNQPPGFTIDNSGLISYDGLSSTQGIYNNIIIETGNGAGITSVTVDFEVAENPLNIPGLTGHYRAEDLLLNDGDLVDTMIDVSNFNNNLIQSSISSRPVFIQDAGGFNAVSFDGLDDNLTNNNLFIPSTGQLLVVVARSTTANLNRSLISFGDGSNQGSLFLNNVSAGNFGANFNGQIPNSPVSGSFNDGNYHVFLSYHDGININQRVDKVNVNNYLQPTAGKNITQFTLGSLALGGNFSQVEIAEAGFVTIIPSITEVEEIEDFLISKYGI